jgi:hypothetical protein
LIGRGGDPMAILCGGGGIVGGGISRSVGSPGRTRSGRGGGGGKLGLDGGGSVHWRTKMHLYIYKSRYVVLVKLFKRHEKRPYNFIFCLQKVPTNTKV